MASSRRAHGGVGTSNEASHSVFTHRGHLGKFLWIRNFEKNDFTYDWQKNASTTFTLFIFVLFQILVPSVHQMKNTLEVRDRAVYQQIWSVIKWCQGAKNVIEIVREATLEIEEGETGKITSIHDTLWKIKNSLSLTHLQKKSWNHFAEA